MIVLIDNYDSFTYNIVQALGTAPPDAPASWSAPELRVIRNRDLSVAEVLALRPDRILISPGPCTPDQAGISMVLILAAAERRLPVLGICLGHQALCQAFGGRIIRAPGGPRHGKTSLVQHDGQGLFHGLASPTAVMRYHSLVAEESSLPACLEITARNQDPPSLIMGVRHRELPLEGIQFHPESIMSPAGPAMLHNFLHPDFPRRAQS